MLCTIGKIFVTSVYFKIKVYLCRHTRQLTYNIRLVINTMFLMVDLKKIKEKECKYLFMYLRGRMIMRERSLLKWLHHSGLVHCSQEPAPSPESRILFAETK